MTIVDYHSRPEISRSMLATFVKSPRLFHAVHVAKAIEDDQESDALTIGTVTHQQLLEPHLEDRIKIIPADVLAKNGARSTNAFKEWSEANSGFIQLLERDNQIVMQAVESIRREIGPMMRHPEAKREHEIYWTDKETGLDLRCKLDLMIPTTHGNFIIDVKTSASLEKFRGAVRDGLWLQFAHYREAGRQEFGDDMNFFFCVVEKSGVFRVRNFTLSQRAADEADERYRSVLSDLSQRMKLNDWSEPGEGEITELEINFKDLTQ